MKENGAKQLAALLALILSVAVLVTFVSCDEAGAGGGDADGAAADSGGVSVALTGASGAVADNGDGFYAFLYAEGEKSIYTAEKVLAVNYANVAADGTATLTLMVSDGNFGPTAIEFLGEAGASYDVYIYTDDDEDEDGEPSTSTRAYRIDPFCCPVTVDGDQTVQVSFSDMIAYTGGTLTVNLTNAAAHDDDVMFFGVFLAGADPMSDDAVGYTDDITITNGAATGEAKFEGNTWYGIDGMAHDLYVIIDKDGNGSANGPTPGDLLYWETYTQSGDEIVNVDAENDFSLFE